MLSTTIRQGIILIGLMMPKKYGLIEIRTPQEVLYEEEDI